MQVSQVNNRLSKIQAKLSYLAMLKIITAIPLQEWFFYDTEESLETLKPGELTITEQAKQIYGDTNLVPLKTYADKVEFEALLPTEELSRFTNWLAGQKEHELRNLAGDMGISALPEQPTKFSENFTLPTEKQAPAVEIIDLEPALENKLISYFLFDNFNSGLDKITEKAEMMTIEQKEKTFEQFLGSNSKFQLPKIALEQKFCTAKITCDFSQMIAIIKSPGLSFVMSPLTTIHNYITPESIINTKYHQPYLQIMENCKQNDQDGNKSTYSIPFAFRQQFICYFNLQALPYLKQQINPVAEQIITLIKKHYSFV